MCNKLVLTMVDHKFEDNLVKDFLPSLRKEGKYDGEIVVLDCGLINPTNPDVRYVHCERFPDFQATVDRLRAKYFLEIIEQYPQAEHIIYFDGGDIWFQDSIEEMFKIEGLGLTAEGPIHWDHSFWVGILNQINLGQEFNNTLYPHSIRSAGVFAGDRNSVIALLTKQIEYTERASSVRWGIDQAIFNYLWHKRETFKSIDMPRKYNFITFTHPYIVKNNKLIDADNNEMPSVVHNAAGQPAPRYYSMY